MTTANNPLVKNVAANPLVVAGKVQRSFYDLVCYGSEESLRETRQELQQFLEAQLAAGAARLSDMVQSLQTKIEIIDANLA